MYHIKEIFYSLVGEGTHSGRSAIFVRFSGCNLWDGREEGRHKAACDFCDTNFVGTNGTNGGQYNKLDLSDVLEKMWAKHTVEQVQPPYVIFTGGEPALQIDQELVDYLKSIGLELGIETNGTKPLPMGLDWVCVSPKMGTDLQVLKGQELKLVYPQTDLDPNCFEHLKFEHFFIQPKSERGDSQANWEGAVEYCLAHPKWKLSLQIHKILDLN